MNLDLFPLVVLITGYFWVLSANETDSMRNSLGEVFSVLDDVHMKDFNPDIKDSNKNNDSTETATDYSGAFSTQDSNNNLNIDATATETQSFLDDFSTNDYDIEESSLVTKQTQKSGGEFERAFSEIEDFTPDDPSRRKDDLSGQNNSKVISSGKHNAKDEENPREDMTIRKEDEDFDMEFERIFDDSVDNDFENNMHQEAQNGHNRQLESLEFGFNLDNVDELRNSEDFHEEYRSPSFKSASLVVAGKKFSGKNGQSFSATTSTYNYPKTSYLLTSDVEIDQGPFVIPRSDSRKTSQLELQNDDLPSNDTAHEAALSRIAIGESIYVLPALTVELGEGNSLWLSPNVRTDLYYEVTNNLNSAARIHFRVTDERSILLSMDKYNVVLNAHGSTRVRLSVIARTDVETDRIIFNAIGAETVQKEAIVRVNKNYRSDDDYPDVDYSYTSDCTDVLLSECHHGTWTIKISARDQDSGLMLLTTIPKGIYFPDGYTAGTTEEVTGFFSDTCCNPNLQIIAVDTLNNRIVKQADAYKATLSFWAIIAIVLFSLIILVSIIAIVICCVKRYKKNQAGSFDLPTYLGRSRY